MMLLTHMAIFSFSYLSPDNLLHRKKCWHSWKVATSQNIFSISPNLRKNYCSKNCFRQTIFFVQFWRFLKVVMKLKKPTEIYPPLVAEIQNWKKLIIWHSSGRRKNKYEYVLKCFFKVHRYDKSFFKMS